MSDDHHPLDERTIYWVQHAVGPGAQVLRSSALVGGVSADMHRLTIRLTSGEPFDVVLRRWTHDPWATGLVRRESAGLTELAKHDLPVPSLIATDPTGAESGVPALLMTAVPGETLLVPDDLHDYVTQLAHVLLRIHELPAELDPTDPHGYEENADRSWIGDLALRRTAEDAAATTGDSQQVLVHGDYHQLNVLWLGQQLSGVVDWSYTGRGQRGIDVGYCRLTLAVLFSADAAAQFLCCYEAESGLRVDPHADIRGLLNFDSDWLDFIPRVVAGRAPVDLAGMAGRVTEVLQLAAARLD